MVTPWRLVLAVSLTLSSVSVSRAEESIKIVLNAEPRSLEPCQSTASDVSRVLAQNIVESLTEISTKDGSIQPRLAVSWQQINPTTWRFKLREGVKFQNGKPFTAADVVYTLDRMPLAPLNCLTRQKMFGDAQLTSKAIDPTTVEVVTSKPLPILPTMMSVVYVVPEGTDNTAPSRAPVGTGAFKFSAWKPGESIVLERADTYWGSKPQFDKATYIWRAESALRAAMVETGEADIAQSIALQDATTEGMDFAYQNAETTRIRLDLQTPPLSDIRVRKALNLAIDKEALKDLVGREVTESAQYVVSAINGFNPNLKPFPYDPKEAKRLLDEARKDGVPVDAKLTLMTRDSYFSNAKEVAEAMMSMWAAVGLKLELKVVDPVTFYSFLNKPFQEGRRLLLTHMHDNNMGDAIFTQLFLYTPEGIASTITDKPLGELINKASAMQGPERTAALQEAFRRIHDDMVADVFMFHMVGYSRVSKRLNWTPDLSTNNMIEISKVKLRS
jgi:peptide/nickel transport system substrate-binding protein